MLQRSCKKSRNFSKKRYPDRARILVKNSKNNRGGLTGLCTSGHFCSIGRHSLLPFFHVPCFYKMTLSKKTKIVLGSKDITNSDSGQFSGYLHCQTYVIRGSKVVNTTHHKGGSARIASPSQCPAKLSC